MAKEKDIFGNEVKCSVCGEEFTKKELDELKKNFGPDLSPLQCPCCEELMYPVHDRCVT
jgi:NAD-dependent SIR2 family protein deacetylase